MMCMWHSSGKQSGLRYFGKVALPPNVEIQVIQLIQVMQVDKCRVHCNDVSVCVYNDASYEG